MNTIEHKPGQEGNAQTPPKELSLPVGVVLRRSPGVTRWAKWVWRAVALLPGAGAAEWRVLREEGAVTEYHAATVPIDLHRAEVEGYKVALAMTPPSAFVVMTPDPGSATGLAIDRVTVSAYEAQDHTDNGEDVVEVVPMSEGLIAWVKAFVDSHYVETPFIKRKRDRVSVDKVEDGIGDARIRQTADVYRIPSQQKPKRRP